MILGNRFSLKQVKWTGDVNHIKIEKIFFRENKNMVLGYNSSKIIFMLLNKGENSSKNCINTF
jgi:hypothetical protein